MANYFDSIPVTLDKPRNLRLNLYGARKFKEITKIDLLQGFEISKFTVEEYTAFIWACLIWEDPELTIEAVERMVDFPGIKMDVLSKMMETLFPTPEKNSPKT
jgi:hypothetical protein